MILYAITDALKLTLDFAMLLVASLSIIVTIIVATVTAGYTLISHSNDQHAANVKNLSDLERSNSTQFAEINGAIRSTTAETNGKIDVLATKVEPMHEWFVKGKLRGRNNK